MLRHRSAPGNVFRPSRKHTCTQGTDFQCPPQQYASGKQKHACDRRLRIFIYLVFAHPHRSSQSACAFVREGHLDPRDFFYVARRRRTTARGWHRQRDGEEEEGPSVRRVVLVLRVRVRAGVGRELTCAAENSKMRKVRGLRDEGATH